MMGKHFFGVTSSRDQVASNSTDTLSREGAVELTYDHCEFLTRVRTISDIVRLKQLGLEPDSMTGMFWRSSVDDLLDFCSQNPGFHVVSYLGRGVFINRYEAKAIIFKLADGDDNPDLLLNAMHVVQSTLAELGMPFKK